VKAEGWFIHAAPTGSPRGRASLVRESFEVGALEDGEVLAAPLFGAWEGNMAHSLARRPIDICRFRDEERVIIGNAGVVEIVDAGRCKSLRAGQKALVFCGADPDPHGYPTTILGYDARGTTGCLATLIKIKERNLIALPESTRHPPARWAAFSLRYITAWSNWRVALGTYRLLVPESQDPSPNVWGWGGGATLAELDLARRQGCSVTMLSGTDRHLETIRNTGVMAIDRRAFPDISVDDERFTKDVAYRGAYARSERLFVAAVQERTAGRGAQIFVDYIGTPVLRATTRALSRNGIIATAGWKEGMQIAYLRAQACIGRQQHINTHYASYDEGVAAVQYAEENGWLPLLDGPTYPFDQIDQLATDFDAGKTSMFPVYAINTSP
jgi:NADPH:quinone reductase-like Zn-dependent oxidoreductase